MVTPYDPDQTRAAIIEAAFEEFWCKGYNGTRVDEIVAKTKFTKGAFYHYFRSKKALAQAVLDTVIGDMLQQRWVEPLRDSANPLETVLTRLHQIKQSNTDEGIRRGCPLNNLAQELSATDEDIRLQVQGYFVQWIATIAEGLARSQQKDQLTREIDPMQLATQIVATFEGGISLAKASRDESSLNMALDGLIRYLESLRPVEA